MYNPIIMKFLIITGMTLLGIVLWWIGAVLIVSATYENLGKYMADVLGFAYSGLLIVAIVFLTRKILKKRKPVAANMEKNEVGDDLEEPLRAKDQAF